MIVYVYVLACVYVRVYVRVHVRVYACVSVCLYTKKLVFEGTDGCLVLKYTA